MSGLGEGSKVFVIESTSNAFAQMDAALASLTDPVAGLHIYSHGREGAIYLGGQWLNEAALTNRSSLLASIGNFLTEDGDILLYGCNTGAGVVGESFMAQLARLTRADVAASSNLTGLGGDWVLENSTGPIESGPVQPDWEGMLGGSTVPTWGIIQGTSGADTLNGFVTNDRFYGNGGDDTMTGGNGNDVYYITVADSNGAVVGTHIIEKDAINGGIDSVFSQVAYFDLGAGVANTAAVNSAVEYIILQAQAGMQAQSAKGTFYEQTITGNALDNNLTGGGGSNYLFGDAGNDNLDGGNGKLTSVTAGTGNDTTGDYHTSNRNTLVGGKGDDNYIVRNFGDSVIENLNEGIDHVYSFVDYFLGANVENLTLLDGDTNNPNAVAQYAIGNALNNVIRSNEQGNNYLDGGAGNDTLNGRIGDFLEGGLGNDLLILRNLDIVPSGYSMTIVDGSGGTDTLRFDDPRALNVNVNANGFVGSSPNGLFAGAIIGVGGTDVDLYVDGVEAVIFGKGNDTVTLVSPVANAKGSMDGGAGTDLLAFDSLPTVLGANSMAGVELTFAATGITTVTKMSTLTTNIAASNFEHFVGTDRNDKFTATAYTFKDGANYTLDGGAGNDTIALGTVNYSAGSWGYGVELYGGDGNDGISVTAIQGMSLVYIDGGNGNDTISVGAVSGNKLFVDGGGGDDRINVGAISSHAMVTIDGGAGNDTINLTGAISGDYANVSISGGAGNDVINVTGAISGGAFIAINGGLGSDSISVGAINSSATVYLNGDTSGGSAGNDTITVGKIATGANLVWLQGDGGDDVYNLQASGMKATIVGESGDGNDKVNLFGVTGTSGANINALNSWNNLVFKKDSNGNVEMSFNGGKDMNILTFSTVSGQDTLSFYSTQTETSKLFGGDVDLDQLYSFVTTNSGFNDGSWHGVTFTGAGTYTATGVKP